MQLVTFKLKPIFIYQPENSRTLKNYARTSLVVQWLRLSDSTAGCMGSISGQGSSSCHVMRPKQCGGWEGWEGKSSEPELISLVIPSLETVIQGRYLLSGEGGAGLLLGTQPGQAGQRVQL